MAFARTPYRPSSLCHTSVSAGDACLGGGIVALPCVCEVHRAVKVTERFDGRRDQLIDTGHVGAPANVVHDQTRPSTGEQKSVLTADPMSCARAAARE